MKKNRLAVVLAAALSLTTAYALAQSETAAANGRAIVTVLAKHNEAAPAIAQADVSAKANGKDAAVTGWAQFKGANDRLELVLLIDSGARNLGRQFEEIGQFIQSLGPDTKITVGYMQNGHAALAGPLTADHKQAAAELHLPAGSPTNPYFTLSDLARNWPSRDLTARREVLLLSDGVDPESPRFDPDDPYVKSAIDDSVRAGLVVYSLYWRSRFEGAENSLTADGGQSLLNQLCDATGGNSYWAGSGNPVSFQPYFADLQRRFENQYALEFTAPFNRKPAVETLKLKIEGLGLQVTAPGLVFVRP